MYFVICGFQYYVRNFYEIPITAQKMKFSIKEFFSKYEQIRRKNADLVTFTKEILNGKLYFLCSEYCV